MQLDDVRAQLNDLAARVPGGSIDVDQVLVRARRTIARRRVARGVVALALVAAIATAGVVVSASRPAPKRRVTVSRPSPTTVTVSEPTTTLARPALSITAGELRAHDGVGVPAGWTPVDEGAARVWVPNDWTLEIAGTCIGGSLNGTSMVSVGRLPNADCRPPSRWTLSESVSLIPTSGVPSGPVYRTVHGYRIYDVTALLRWDAAYRVYDVPQLGLRLAIHGNVDDRILSSLAPSARRVALAFAAQPRPGRYRKIAEEGLRLSIPPDWAVRTPDSFNCGPFGAALPGVPELDRIGPDISAPPCPGKIPAAADAAHDGAYLYTPNGDQAPSPGARALAVLHHGATTVTLYVNRYAINVLDVFAQRAGSSTMHALTLGLGRDGRVAGGVLASIEATS